VILLIIVFLALAAMLLSGGSSHLQASSVALLSDEIYPDKRAAERRIDRLLGWLYIVAAVVSGAVAIVAMLSLLR
jgi:hypothetical protein